jgi:hypothetical protein
MVKPFFLLQHNWFKMMEYFQSEMLSYYSNRSGTPVYKIAFQYATDKEGNKAALNFHLTKREERDIVISIRSAMNQQSFNQVKKLFDKRSGIDSAGLPAYFH